MMFKAILFACFLLTYSVSADSETETKTESSDNDDPPTVTLSYGTIQGIRDTNATMFLGIPFAEPPVKDLRWKDPIDVKPWKPSIYYATDFRPACAQSICGPATICPNITSEDCLYLNIYVPLNASATDLKAVMVYIHGGNFQWMSGSSPLFDGRYFARQEDVVIVTINYRLGSLGFLVTGTDKNQLHGNYGILDQKMAVKWIKNNIEAFFGDPERITLFGQSAGAQSIAAHLLSTDMQPYFNNAIVQSSPFAIPFRGFDEAMTIYYYFAEYLNCTLRDIDCLMSKSTEDIITAQMKTEVDLTSLKFLVFFEPWLPYLDGKTIKGQLLEFEKWELPSDFKFKPMIVGTLTGECYNYIYGAFQKPITTKMLVGIAFAAFKQHTLDVAEMYPPDITNPDQRELMVKACTSWVFACGSRNFLEKAQFWYPRDLTIGYQYIFDYPLDFPGWDNGTDYCYNYTCHGSDCPYTFDVPDANFTADGRYIAQTHMKYWSNFAKYNTTQSSKGIEWPSYDPKSRQYLRFQKPQNTLEAHYREKECNMFDKIGYYY